MKKYLIKNIIYFLLSISVVFTESITFNTESDIYGFQFKLTGIENISVNGGASESAGFNISVGSNGIIGFSLSSSYIPAGSGILIEFDYLNGENPCIDELILSGYNGENIVTRVDDCLSIVEVCHGIPDCKLQEIMYNTESDIYGFQFNVENVELINISGGDAVKENFQISFSSMSGNIIGFSLDGSFIEGGSGTLINIEYISSQIPCINDLILSGDNGTSISTFIDNCININEGCEEIDNCGICGGDGYSCLECSSLIQYECEESSYCDWLSETVSCSGLSSSLCNAANGCSWVSGGGGPYGGGSSYCSGGTGQINGICTEVECNFLPEENCNYSNNCNWGIDGCVEIQILGCTDVNAENFSIDANTNDGSCEYAPLGVLSFENFNYQNNTVEVHLNCEYPVSNFEFAIEGLDIVSFGGGASENYNFTIESNNNIIYGSSNDQTIPADAGFLLRMTFAEYDETICFEQSTITTYVGIQYEAILGGCIIPGCIDDTACNYNQNANADNGNCQVNDCAETCGGDAYLDDCEICSGGMSGHENNSDIDDCGVCFGNNIDMDACGICGGVNIDCCPGDANQDMTIDILDVILLIEVIIEGLWFEEGLFCSDLVNDESLDIFDIVKLVDMILMDDLRIEREDASFASLFIRDNTIELASDGYIGGVQIRLIHESEIEINLTDRAFIAEYRTIDGVTNIIIIGLETSELFTIIGEYYIDEIMVANSQTQIDILDCIGLDESQCEIDESCDWIEDSSSVSCSSLSEIECGQVQGCNWGCTNWGSWYTWICYGTYACLGGTGEISGGFCEENNFMMGDINEDFNINVLDVIGIINIIITDGYNIIADLNEDNELNVLDVVLVVNIILGN